MRFDRAPETQPPPIAPVTPSDRLVRRTSRSLALVTLALIAALLGGVGVVTAAVAISMSDQTVDQNLESAAHTRLAALEDMSWEGDKAEDSGEGSDEETPSEGPRTENGETGETGGALPATTPQPTTTAVPSATQPTGPGVFDPDHSQLESADTFFLVLDRNGALISSSEAISLTGLPYKEAITESSSTHADDLRSVVLGGIHLRLLTERVVNSKGEVVAYLQAGFVLTQHDQQNNAILMTILLTSLVGLFGAALVTLLVTSRAMGPIRSAFTAERRFVASASHELRTPVAVVRASAELLQREDLIKPEGRQLVEDIVSESDRLSRLVGDLLALASAEAGAIDVKPEPIEMRAFVAELARRAETIGTERGVRIEVIQEGAAAAAHRELLVNADPDRMTQLLLIFVDNAIDHSPAGGTVRLVVGPTSDGGKPQVSVGVADEGPGVPRHERLRIFEPFARLAGRRQAGNAGLGLAIARILAARQDATLHVDDAVGGGAVFSVWLPRRPRPGTSPSA